MQLCYTKECYQVNSLLVYWENHQKLIQAIVYLHGRKMAATSEDWFGQLNKYQYLELMMIMTKQDCTTVKGVHEVLKNTCKWVDLGKFVKRHKH